MDLTESFVSELSDSDDEGKEIIEEVIDKSPEIQVATYPDEKLEAFVGFIKQLTTLFYLKEDDWTTENIDKIKEWFIQVSEKLMLIFYDGDNLTVLFDYPLSPVYDLTYFLRRPNYTFTVENFHDEIISGTLHEDIDGSLLRIIEAVYAPLFFNKREWQENIKSHLCNDLNSFLGFLTGLHYKISGICVLYIPYEGCELDPDDVLQERELMKRIETVVNFWMTQIRLCLNDTKQLVPYDLVCPTDEYDFWTYRFEALCGLSYQLKHPDIQRIHEILKKSHSVYLNQFNEIIAETEEELEKSKSNLNYLQILVKPCILLEASALPTDIPSQLIRIMYLIRVIWANSKYYNTKEIITGLYRTLSNLIIIYCRNKIDIDKVLSGYTRNGIEIANMSIDCCEAYKQIYQHVLKKNKDSKPDFDWDLDLSSIFNQIDAFVQRLVDVIEICEAMIVFGRYDEREAIPKPLFGGRRYKEFQKICEQIEKNFDAGLDRIRAKSHIILEVHDNSWYDHIAKFRQLLRHLEEITENLMSSVFLEIGNVEEGLEALYVLRNFSHRKLLRETYINKTSQLWERFKDAVAITNREVLEQKNQRPTFLPSYSGRALLLNLKFKRLQRVKQLMEEAEWLPQNSNSYGAMEAFKNIELGMKKNINSLNEEWIESIGLNLMVKLQRPLMCRSISHAGLLECNIDRQILNIMDEAHHFNLLKMPFPANVNQIFLKSASLRYIYESVVTVVLDYNKILAALSDKERVLFKALIRVCERRITPGIYKLTWGGDLSDAYIAECVKYTSQLQDFLDIYKIANLSVVRMCEQICDTSILKIKNTEAVTLENLAESLEDYTRATAKKLLSFYKNIIEYIIIVYQGFQNEMENMVDEWLEYIKRFDNLIQEAFRICAKNSLTTVYNALHGDGTMGPLPLIKMDIDLIENKLTFTPLMQSCADLLGYTFNSILGVLRNFPRLADKFHLPVKEQPVSFANVVKNDEECRRINRKIIDEIQRNQDHLFNYTEIWVPFRSQWELDKELFMKHFEEANPDAPTFDVNIARNTETANKVSMLETFSAVYFVVVDSSKLKKSILAHIDQWQTLLTDMLRRRAYDKITKLYEYTKTNAETVLVEPVDLLSMQNLISLYNKLKAEVPSKEEEFPSIKDHFRILDKYEITISSGMRQIFTNMTNQWNWYLGKLKEADDLIDVSKDQFKLALLDETKDLKREAKKLLETFAEKAPFTSATSPTDALESLREMRKNLEQAYVKEAKLIADLEIFGINQPENLDLKRLDKELKQLEEVWEVAFQWEQSWIQYRSGCFWTIVIDEMENTAVDLFRKLNKMSKMYKDKNWEILETTRRQVDEFRKTLPLIVALKNTAMRDRHWDRVREVVEIDFDQNSEDFKLEAIIAMNFQKFSEDIVDISNSATMELQIENGIKNIRELWKTVTIEIVPFKENVYRIKSVDDCFQTLEENAVQISAMKATRFVEPFAKEVDYWEKTLSYIMECLENALIVQRQWLYLENIFAGEDIRKQLPKEAQQFSYLSDEWSEITVNMFKEKFALNATHYRPPNYLLDKLNQMSEKLEYVQRQLEIYLETKRQLFPRFYFISNDDLLEILGNAKKPDVIQPHMRKLFDNLVKLKLNRNALTKTIKWEAHGMYSDDGEYVQFHSIIILDGPAEKWLSIVEINMRQILKEQLKLTRQSLKKLISKRDKWIGMWPGQLCLTSSQLQWTTDCTRSLTHCKILNERKPLKRLKKKQNSILAKLSEQSRKDLAKQLRLKVNSIITIEIHGRDVIDRMYRMNCRDVSEFEWLSQLRFYWDREHDNCIIRQTNTHNWYGYEYTGNSGRLVITPLTDRCYITLTTALHLHRGGSPKGPAGTGKTETVKDLGKAIGLWVIVNNCSEGLDYKSMGKSFSGLAQTGCWGCFDEFNRINIEVLSVVAQQILSILTALAQGLKHFIFEGNDIKLVSTIGLFITMNPGYAGRTELPDNLKSMFRPISMIVPDNIIIAENLLFSDGFEMTKSLAKKVFTLYELAKQQLSKQNHYDFGLRSMVALLRYAGRKRRQFPTVNEEEIVYLAMKDMNIAKLTSDDFPLFNGIMSDIFPGVTIPVIDYEEFLTSIENELDSLGLKKVPIAVTKVIQLYETKNSRHSVMILGNTGTAKSVTWKVLKGAFCRMKALGRPGWNDVLEYPINPKALSQGELYGEYNLSTGEWFDGVLSATMRKICTDESPDQKWLLFDGPVDAVWIENMNSVMDDNKVLTLVNSERITMPEQVSLLFEVGDLTVASPATVSRCGMVYNDYKDWGWRPYVDSWLQKQNPVEYRAHLVELFNRFVGNLLEFKSKLVETVPVNELNLIQSLCRLLEAFGTKENGIDASDKESLERMTKMWFLFSLIWSVCATVNESGRLKIDNYIREIEGIFPLKDTIYDYFVDPRQNAFIPWEDKLSESWRYNKKLPFYKIIVPTVDTIRYDFLVATLLNRKVPVALVGPVGTGKTSTALNVLDQLNKERYNLLIINMSAQTTSNNIQETIESRTEKRTKELYVPIGGKTMVCFMDDFNMPAKEFYGSQPPLELIRQWIDYGFWYDRIHQWRISVKQMLLMAGMGPPGGGRQTISPRTLSRFNVINMTFPSDASITRIFGTMLTQQLLDFSDEAKMIGKDVTLVSIDLYASVIEKMLPTPSKIHYLFNLRDISRIFQGLLRSNREYHTTKPMFLKLWIHECFRVFSDRLIDDKDQEWFVSCINEKLGKFFEATFHSLCPSKECPIFGDFISSYGYYEELADPNNLREFMYLQLSDYNNSPGVVATDLVLFKEAIEHIVRMVRVVSQPRGNMLLIGIGGSGRQSLARLASYICELNTFQIEVTKNYHVSEFREDLKVLFSKTGVDAKATTFLFNDTQVAEESFMEIINNLLSTGEVANLYKPDEFDEIKNKLETAAHKAGILPTTEAIYSFFIDRSRSNLHIIICMSPIGDNFRMRIRQYPSLVNCTTIDWFREWPKQALLEVSQKYLAECELDVSITEKQISTRRESLIQTTETKLKLAVANVMSIIHTSVTKMSDLMFVEMKRHNYVTPTNYLELVSGYKEMLKDKRIEIAGNANKLRNGLSKIDDTREKVEIMSEELVVSQEKVTEFQAQCDEFIIVIKVQTAEADTQKQEVALKSVRISEEEAQIKILAAQAQVDLDKAMPALEAAMKALDALNKKDLTEVKSYGRPPPKVERVMEAVMILLEKEPTWNEAKRQLGEQKFLDDLRNFDKDHITDKTLKKISHYTMDPELEPEKVGIVSFACKSLILWVRAIERYGKIYKIVGPKKQRLEETLESLRIKQELLADAQEKLAELERKLNKLQADYDAKSAEKEELRRRAEVLKLQLERAYALVDGLSGERIRWIDTVKKLDLEFSYLPGNCLLAVAFISYLGPFVTKYRDELVQFWEDEVKRFEIPCSQEFYIIAFCADPTVIREWNIQGLPSDGFSTENGIIVTKSKRWPLVIDPQAQAHTWIKNLAKDKDLQIIDFGQKNYIHTLELSIRFGYYVLLQNIMEELDPALQPILNRAIIKQGGENLIKFNDTLISYNDNFRFLITTKLSNPHYPPEISTKTTLVNFAVKEEGLQAQLLGIVVKKERPSLEEQKNMLVVNIARNKRTLVDLENEILRLLNESRGSLLDDEELFSTLQSSKQTSAIVVESLAVAEVTEIEIDSARGGYQPSAHRAAILFFVLMDMSRIDPMYQFSLDSYIVLFISSIDKSQKNPNLEERIINLNEYHTQSVYRNTCRGLFEKHKLLFSFHMCAKILDADGKLNNVQYEFLLKGGIVLNRQEQAENPCPTWISDIAWDNITELDKLPGYHGVIDSFEQSSKEWKEWYSGAEPETLPLVGEWNKLTSFQKMLFIRCLRPDRITSCAMSFITSVLGPEFIEPPVLDVKAVFEESIAKTPLIFVLSPGVDPTSTLLQLAETMKMTKKFNSLSLGQGQAPIATQMIEDGIKHGLWIFLANCHLSLSWMPALDKIVERLQSEPCNRKFRLWLSSSPHPDFPISILQAGIKMTTEPPKGLKANLKRLYNLVTDEQFMACKTKEKYKKMLFSLIFFHSILIERKKFQELGWNIIYSFNDSDFEVSENLLSIYLDEYTDTPWDALKYLISDVNYGGHVTDDFDRRLLSTYINQFYNDNALETQNYRLSALPTYYIPRDGTLQSYKDYIGLLPNFDRPEAFGQHANADIASLISETRVLFETLTSLQVQSSGGGGETKEDKVNNLAADILSKIPSPIDYENTEKLIGVSKKPLDVVLLQEISRYNELLIQIKLQLENLQKGIKGLVVMSSDLEDIFNAMFEAKVPTVWLTTYSSLKPLGSWARDLVLRIDHFAKWAKTVRPPLFFWLAAYTFPTGFLTAVLQTSSRLNTIPIDALSWEFIVFVADEGININPPTDGVFVKGMFLEGAGWDKKNQQLKEPMPMELITPMPLIHFKPTESSRKRTRGLYQCPTYYLPQRAGNFVIAVDLKSGPENADFWIKRGTAMLLSLAD